MKIAAVPDGHGGDRSALRRPAHASGRGARVTRWRAAQLRSDFGAGVLLSVEVDEVSLEVDELLDELSVDGAAAGAAEVSVVVVVVDESVGAALFSVVDGSVAVVLLDIELSAAGCDCVVVVVVVEASVDWATAAPMPVTRAAAAATADSFF